MKLGSPLSGGLVKDFHRKKRALLPKIALSVRERRDFPGPVALCVWGRRTAPSLSRERDWERSSRVKRAAALHGDF
jgi:hypothetical protein